MDRELANFLLDIFMSVGFRYPRTNPNAPADRVPSSVYLGDDDYAYKVRRLTQFDPEKRLI